MREAAVEGSGREAERAGDPAVDVRQIGGDDQRRHGARAQALEAHTPEHGADQAVREIVHLGFLPTGRWGGEPPEAVEG